MKDIEEIKKHPFPFVHPDDIDPYDEVHLFRALIGKTHKMINAEDYISYTSSNVVSNSMVWSNVLLNQYLFQIKYAQLLACFMSKEGKRYCAIKPMRSIEVGTNAVLNEFDCPLLERVEVIRSTNVLVAVSIVHECSSTCTFTEERRFQTIERQTVSQNSLVYHHDFSNFEHLQNDVAKVTHQHTYYNMQPCSHYTYVLAC